MPLCQTLGSRGFCIRSQGSLEKWLIPGLLHQRAGKGLQADVRTQKPAPNQLGMEHHSCSFLSVTARKPRTQEKAGLRGQVCAVWGAYTSGRQAPSCCSCNYVKIKSFRKIYSAATWDDWHRRGLEKAEERLVRSRPHVSAWAPGP